MVARMAHRIRRVPAGVRLIAVCTAVLLSLLPLRMGPVSAAVNGRYWESYGQHPDALVGMPTHVSMKLPSGQHSLYVEAEVELPDAPGVRVYRVSHRMPDAERMAQALGLDSSQLEVEEVVDSFSYRGYDLMASDIFYANGYSTLNECGRVSVGAYLSELPALDGNGVKELLRAADIVLSGDARVRYSPTQDMWMAREVVDGMPLASTFSFDAYTGDPSAACAVRVVGRPGINLLEVSTDMCIGDIEAIWEGCHIVPVEQALRALAEARAEAGHASDMAVDAISLAYQVRTVYGDAQHSVLYPVWEVWATGVDDALPVGIVNAINGEVERCNA